MGSADLFLKIDADNKGLLTGLAASSSAISRFASSAKVGFVAAGVAATAASVKMAADFQTSMTKITALVGVSRKQVDAWGQDILKLSTEIPEAPLAFADAMFFVTSAGFRGAQALDVLTLSGKAAAAGLGSMRDIADVVTSAMNAYADAGLKASQVTDTLIAAVTRGKFAPEDLAQNLGQVLPVASLVGISFDQVAASIAAVSRQGLSVPRATTALRFLLGSFIRPSSQASDALETIGLSVQDLQDSLASRGLLATLNMLSQKFDITTAVGKKLFATVLGGSRGSYVALALVGDRLEENEKIFAAVRDSAGETDRAFSEMSHTAQFQFKLIVSSIQAAAIEFGSIFLPVVSQGARDILFLLRPIVLGVRFLSQALRGLQPVLVGVFQAFLAWEALRFISPLIGRMVGQFTSFGRAVIGLATGLPSRISSIATALVTFVRNPAAAWQALLVKLGLVQSATTETAAETVAASATTATATGAIADAEDGLAASSGVATTALGAQTVVLKAKLAAIGLLGKSLAGLIGMEAGLAAAAGAATLALGAQAAAAGAAALSAGAGPVAEIAGGVASKALGSGILDTAEIAPGMFAPIAGELEGVTAAAGDAAGAVDGLGTAIVGLDITLPVIGLIVTALAGLVVFVITHARQIQAAMQTAWTGIKADAIKTWNDIVQTVRPAFDDLSTAASQFWQAIQQAWTAIKPAFEAVGAAVLKVAEAFSKALGPVGALILKLSLGLTLTVIIGALETLAAVLQAAATVVQFFAGLWEAAWPTIEAVFLDFVNNFIHGANAFIHGINAIIHGLNLLKPGKDIGTIDTIKPLTAAALDAADGVGKLGSAVAAANPKIAETGGAAASATQPMVDFAAASEEAFKRYESVPAILDHASSAVQSLARVTGQSFLDFRKAAADAFNQTSAAVQKWAQDNSHASEIVKQHTISSMIATGKWGEFVQQTLASARQAIQQWQATTTGQLNLVGSAFADMIQNWSGNLAQMKSKLQQSLQDERTFIKNIKAILSDGTVGSHLLAQALIDAGAAGIKAAKDLASHPAIRAGFERLQRLGQSTAEKAATQFSKPLIGAIDKVARELNKLTALFTAMLEVQTGIDINDDGVIGVLSDVQKLHQKLQEESRAKHGIHMTADTDQAIAKIQDVNDRGNALDHKRFVPEVAADNAAALKSLQDVTDKGNVLDHKRFIPDVEVGGNWNSQLHTVETSLNQLDGKQIQTFVNVHTRRVQHAGGAVFHAGGAVFHAGGAVKRMHSGGLKSDEVPAVLQRGEFVINRSSAQRIGMSNLSAMNQMHDGGAVAQGSNDLSNLVGRNAIGKLVGQLRGGPHDRIRVPDLSTLPDQLAGLIRRGRDAIKVTATDNEARGWVRTLLREMLRPGLSSLQHTLIRNAYEAVRDIDGGEAAATYREALRAAVHRFEGFVPHLGSKELSGLVGRVHGGLPVKLHSGGEVPAVLQTGEFVMRRSAVSAIGTPALMGMNRMHEGGPVLEDTPAWTRGARALASAPEDVRMTVRPDRRRFGRDLDYSDITSGH